MSIKITDSDKHYISEYYIRKWFIVNWTNQTMNLTKRGSWIGCSKTWVWGLVKVRDFIESVDKYLHTIIK